MTQPTQPAGGPPDRPAYAPQPEYTEHVSRFNPVVAVLGVVAAVLGVLAITVLDWYRDDYSSLRGSGSSASFGDIHDALDGAKSGGGVSFGVSPVYFGWLAYVLIAVAVLGALASAAVSSGALRTITAIVSIGGLAVTLWAIQLIHVDDNARSELSGTKSGYFDWLKHTSFGAWAMLLAFLLCFVAALIRPRRQRSRGY